MPVDFIFPPSVGANQSVSLDADANFAAAYLGCIVKLGNHELSLVADGSTDGFFVVCGPGTLVQGEDEYPLTASQAMFATYAGESFFLVEQADVDLGAITAHISRTDNPHAVTKAQVGLANVANTAPADLPVSTAQAAADTAARDAAVATAAADATAKANAAQAAAIATASADATAKADAAKSRAVHTGTQPISSVDGLAELLAAKVPLPMLRSTAQGPPTPPVAAVAYLAIQAVTTGKTLTIGGRIYTGLVPDNGAASALFSDAASLVACINGLRAGVAADANVTAEVITGAYPGMIKLTHKVPGADGNDLEISRGAGTTVMFLLGGSIESLGNTTPITMEGGSDGVVPEKPGQVCYTGDAAPYRVDIGLPDGTWMQVPDATKVMGV